MLQRGGDYKVLYSARDSENGIAAGAAQHETRRGRDPHQMKGVDEIYHVPTNQLTKPL